MNMKWNKSPTRLLTIILCSLSGSFAFSHFTRYFPDPEKPDGLEPKGGIWRIREDVDGYLWLAADFVPTKFDSRTGKCAHYAPHPEEKHLNALYKDKAGFWWTGGDTGLYRFDSSFHSLKRQSGCW